MALSSSKQHSRISSFATIRFFQPNDRAACQKIFVDGSNESVKDKCLFFLTRVTWYFTVGAVPASFTAIIWSPWILAVYFLLAFLFFVCPIIYWLSIFKSWQKFRLNTKFSLSDGGQIWVAELNSKVVGMVRLTPQDPGVSELQMMYVVPHCRKIGIEIKKRPDVPRPFKTFAYDTMKIQHKAHGAKTSDPVINTENDEALILKLDSSLHDNGIEHETEISLFKKEDYKKYQANPILKW